MAEEYRRAAHFNTLLVFLVVLYTAVPFLPGWVAVLGLPRIAIELALVTAVWRLRVGRVVPVLVTVVMLVNEITHAVAFTSPSPAIAMLRAVWILIFLAVAIGFLAWFFWREERVGPGFLSGAVSLYLLLGFFWASSFKLIEFVEPGSFRGICAPRPTGVTDCDLAIGQYPRLDYLGFVTMTTLGYGDIVPLTRRAERLTTISAVTGQLFIAVLIGRIVANSRPPRRED
ncbi:MAG: two pore domain potassium channel family protein [Deltaproteobacteria bacterium]|nr:two pore domain potassium channel family protein [Deltaproteobacteria bacterium]MBW2444488.1 two pore domain potassium channel family protein [Deltaproteobacteria bacterium]